MSDLTPATQSLSLFQIESELRELMDFRDTEELTAEERQAVEQQIAAYVAKELGKVDNLRGFMRHCEIMAKSAKEEAELQAKRAKSWQTRLDYLKGCCLDAMSIIGKKKLEGRTGSIEAKGNGGKRALTIYDDKLLVSGYKRLTIYCNLSNWELFHSCAQSDDYVRVKLSHLMASKEFRALIEPDNEAIRAALEKPCEACKDHPGWATPPPDSLECEACNGSGKHVVSGARLEPRGAHCEIR